MFLVDTDEHQMLRESVRDFLADHCSESDVRRLMVTESGYAPETWSRAVRELGLPAIGIAECHGGLGGGYTELGVVLEESGRVLSGLPLFGTAGLAATFLARCGDEHAADPLAAIAAGEATATAAIDDPGGQISAGCTAIRADDGWRLSGVKDHVVDGATSDLLLVVARAGDRWGLFIASGGSPGIKRRTRPTLDQTRRQAEVIFDRASVSLVTPLFDDFSPIAASIAACGALLAAEQLGGAERCLELATTYAQVRHQFGVPIGSFQAIKHRCADMLLAVESARSAVRAALWALTAGDSDAVELAYIARSTASEVFVRLASDVIQVHGGIGFTWEHPAHLYLKRAQTSARLLGSPYAARTALAAALGW